MTGLRPRVSARGPERGALSRARKEVLDAMSDLSQVLGIREREVPREMRVLDMTPVLMDALARLSFVLRR